MTPAELKTKAAEQVRERVTPPQRRILPSYHPSLLASLLGGRLGRWLRPLVDVVALAVAVVATVNWPGESVPLHNAWLLIGFVPLAIALLCARGMYAQRLRATVLDSVLPVAGSLSAGVLGVALADIYVGTARLEPPVFVHLWALALVLVGTARLLALLAQRAARVRGLVGHRTLIVGAGFVGARIARRLEEQPEYGLRPVGFLDADPVATPTIGETGVPVLGSPADLEWIAQLTGADHVVLAFSAQPDERLIELVRHSEQLGLEVLLVPRLFDSLNHRTSYEPLGGLPLQRLRSISPRGWQFAVKHAIDRAGAAFALTIFLPLMLLIAAAIRFTSPGPVLFRQQRVGRDGKMFNLLKFRSMLLEPAAGGSASLGLLTPVAIGSRGSDTGPAAIARESQLAISGSLGDMAPGGVEGADRRTAVGRMLRRFSLDELPQLINVLRGQMSLVGPRPERPEFVELFEVDVDRYGDRHRVKSGITGWAQVHGLRGPTSLADRVEWDNFYIEHWSLGLDLKVLALTLVAIFRAAE